MPRLGAMPQSHCSSRGERLWVQISAPASAASYRSHFAEVSGHFLAWRPGLAPSPAIAHQRCLLAQPQWWFALVPACEQPVHGALVSDATQLLPLFFCPVRGTLDSLCGCGCGFGRSRSRGQYSMGMTQFQVMVHGFEELLDAHLSKGFGMLCARLIKKLTLNVDVVGPVLALEKGNLREAGPHRAYHERQ